MTDLDYILDYMEHLATFDQEQEKLQQRVQGAREEYKQAHQLIREELELKKKSAALLKLKRGDQSKGGDPEEEMCGLYEHIYDEHEKYKAFVEALATQTNLLKLSETLNTDPKSAVQNVVNYFKARRGSTGTATSGYFNPELDSSQEANLIPQRKANRYVLPAFIAGITIAAVTGGFFLRPLYDSYARREQVASAEQQKNNKTDRTDRLDGGTRAKGVATPLDTHRKDAGAAASASEEKFKFIGLECRVNERKPDGVPCYPTWRGPAEDTRCDVILNTSRKIYQSRAIIELNPFYVEVTEHIKDYQVEVICKGKDGSEIRNPAGKTNFSWSPDSRAPQSTAPVQPKKEKSRASSPPAAAGSSPPNDGAPQQPLSQPAPAATGPALLGDGVVHSQPDDPHISIPGFQGGSAKQPDAGVAHPKMKSLTLSLTPNLSEYSPGGIIAGTYAAAGGTLKGCASYERIRLIIKESTKSFTFTVPSTSGNIGITCDNGFDATRTITVKKK